MSSIQGADELINDLEQLGYRMPEVKKSMLKAGGEILAEGWRWGIMKHDYRDSEKMLDNVKCKLKVQHGILRAVVTSAGVDDHGVRNAAKAYMLHYGTHRMQPGSHWIDEVEDDFGPAAAAEMKRILDEALNRTVAGGNQPGTLVSQSLGRQAANAYFINPKDPGYIASYKAQHKKRR